MGVEHRLADFTELVATAIAKVQAREELRTLAEEQAALRRVATLVARGDAPEAIFAAVAEELGRLVQSDRTLVARYEADNTVTILAGSSRTGEPPPVGLRGLIDEHSVTNLVRTTGRVARMDSFPDDADGLAAMVGNRSAVGAPIIVSGRLWGLMVVGSSGDEPPPAGTEERLANFTELVATAIANAHGREELRTLADEQAALRRVATLVAGATPPAEVFAAVAEEVGRLVRTDRAFVSRYEIGDTVTILAGWTLSGEELPVHVRFPIQEYSVSNLVRKTVRAVRIDAYPGGRASPVGNRSAVGVPITVEGRLWGLMTVGSISGEPSPPGTEDRLTNFTELVATAIANAQAREELRRVAEEQAALRRVATLVAEGAPPDAVFAAATEESGRLLDGDFTSITHYESDSYGRIITGWAPKDIDLPIGFGAPLEGRNVATLVHSTGRPARIEQFGADHGPLAAPVVGGGVRCAVGAPISVEGRLWGVMVVGFVGEQPAPGAELRLGAFTELLATAIANAQAREELQALADEQAALRNVATLVAERAASEELFSAVAREATQVLRVSAATLDRYESDGTAVTLALSRDPDWDIADNVAYPGARWPNEPGGLVALVWQSGDAARVDDYSEISGATGDSARTAGLSSACAAPITVDGKLWGLIRVYARDNVRLPDDTEARLHGFAELVATAIANAQAQAELTASRARIVATADETRRRIERDLHDGAQQRLITLGLRLRAAQVSVPQELDRLAQELDDVALGLTSAIDELREYARGIHPAILAEGGIGPALRTVARRSSVPVVLDMRTDGRLPEPIEVAAYYVVSEVLANAAKHAGASVATVDVETVDDVLRIVARDDGVGGAEFARGSGLVGLRDRVEALGGRMSLESPRGEGTTIEVELPVAVGLAESTNVTAPDSPRV